MKKTCGRTGTFFYLVSAEKKSKIKEHKAMQGTDLRLGVLLEPATGFKVAKQMEQIHEKFFEFHG